MCRAGFERKGVEKIVFLCSEIEEGEGGRLRFGASDDGSRGRIAEQGKKEEAESSSEERGWENELSEISNSQSREGWLSTRSMFFLLLLMVYRVLPGLEDLGVRVETRNMTCHFQRSGIGDHPQQRHL